jgi:UV DNA damage endonuclease
MKIGYPCINRRIGCTTASTFRLASYSNERFLETVHNNLHCLKRILHFNGDNGLRLFRISSDTIPFASHPICLVDWVETFQGDFTSIGNFIKIQGIRMSMHPDQFTLINSPKDHVMEQSRSELLYHARFLDALKLDYDAKIQIHVGGVYGDKDASIARFVRNYGALSENIKQRLVIENDDRLFSLQDCLAIHRATGIPVLLDILHHNCLNNGETLQEALQLALSTWQEKDGIPMVDYSVQQEGARRGKHGESINVWDFSAFLGETIGLEFDLMLEIKDKENSALTALKIIQQTPIGAHNSL